MNETTKKPWIAYGSEWPEHEDYLIGNREGFIRLRNAIDAVIENGTVDIEDPGIEYNGLKVVESDPRVVYQKAKANGLFAAFMITVFLGIMGLLLMGVWKLVEIVK